MLNRNKASLQRGILVRVARGSAFEFAIQGQPAHLDVPDQNGGVHSTKMETHT